jgi:hypothetical protein
MGKVIVVFILHNVTLRTRKIPLITLESLHAATISLDSSLKRAEKSLYKLKTTITFPICNLFHLCCLATKFYLAVSKIGKSRFFSCVCGKSLFLALLLHTIYIIQCTVLYSILYCICNVM